MRIAIVKLSSLGDIVHSMVALQFIKRTYPDAKIDWIVEDKFKGILENNPHLNNIYTIDLKKAKKQKSIFLLFKELKKIRKLKEYDFVIDAQGLLKSAIVAKMISTKQHSGFDKKSIREPLASIFYNYKVSVAYHKNSVDRNIAVICIPLNIRLQSNDIFDKKPFVIPSVKNKLLIGKYIVFVVGSTWESRNYPKEKFVEISNKLQKKCLIIWGTESEKIKANWMALQSEYIEVAPKLKLDDLKGIIKNSALVIGNDTGPSHIAWAMNIPSIILFGPTPVSRVYQTKINKVIKSSSKVDSYNLDKNDFSIKEIQVDDVVKISKELLG
jgi:heptosyltransferase I